jgi:hypothetical protein
LNLRFREAERSPESTRRWQSAVLSAEGGSRRPGNAIHGADPTIYETIETGNEIILRFRPEKCRLEMRQS